MRDEILRLLKAANSENVSVGCKQLLREAIKVTIQWEAEGTQSSKSDAIILNAQIHGSLALEEENPQERTKCWLRALSLLKNQGLTNAKIANAYGTLSVDCFQDNFSSLQQEDKTGFLITATKEIDKCMKSSQEKEIKSSLLSRKSAIIRHRSLLEVSHTTRCKMLGESIRCAEKANSEFSNPASLLELALSNWAIARYEKNDAKYYEQTKKVEQILLDEKFECFEPARLTLARFYRMNYQPLEACEKFLKFASMPNNRRLWLRESYIFAEATIQLWFNKYPEDYVNHYLAVAGEWLQYAISAGYNDARMLIDSAYIMAISNNRESGRLEIKSIAKSGEIDWQQASAIVTLKKHESTLLNGFAIGINQGAVWTSLGTYYLHFEQDADLVKLMYETAIKIDPHNPIALTNLARFLINHGGEASFDEAERFLQRAKTFSDRRFGWWQYVMNELREKREQLQADKKLLQKHISDSSVDSIIQMPRNKSTGTIKKSDLEFTQMKEIMKHFKAVKDWTDHQTRGYELERIFYNVARIHGCECDSSYRFKRPNSSKIHQVDLFFRVYATSYRCECKWEEHKTSFDEITKFKKKLDVSKIYGLVISMSGFDESAIKDVEDERKNVPVLLMDGEEVNYILKGMIGFIDAIELKRHHFESKSNSYFKVRPNLVAA